MLSPVALVHLLLLTLRRTAYRLNIFTTNSFPVPTIVVGNVVVGGTGKTPVVIALVNHFQGQGFFVGVASRGYGRESDETLEVEAGMAIALTGDEPALIKSKTGAPVVVAKRRSEAVKQLLLSYAHVDIVICDDGLQHYALNRDIEIAVFDDRGIGNGWLLPAGLLREPWRHRQEREIDFVLHTGQTPRFAGYRCKRELGTYATAANGKQIALSSLRNKRVIALAAVGNPEAFFNMLRDSGVTLTETISLPDHYAFPTGLEGINANVSHVDAVLCTEKDAIKLFANSAPIAENIFSIPLVTAPDAEFYVALDALLAPLTNKKKSQVLSPDGH